MEQKIDWKKPRVRVTTVAVGKQITTYLSVCL